MSAVTGVLALLIGTSLGLVGAGGSILTVPALVHAGGFAPRDAIVASLIVVGVSATAAPPGSEASVPWGRWEARGSGVSCPEPG